MSIRNCYVHVEQKMNDGAEAKIVISLAKKLSLRWGS
jgi:hypothetical protein